MFPQGRKSKEKVEEALTTVNLEAGLVSQLPKETHLICGAGRFAVLASLVKFIPARAVWDNHIGTGSVEKCEKCGSIQVSIWEEAFTSLGRERIRKCIIQHFLLICKLLFSSELICLKNAQRGRAKQKVNVLKCLTEIQMFVKKCVCYSAHREHQCLLCLLGCINQMTGEGWTWH